MAKLDVQIEYPSELSSKQRERVLALLRESLLGLAVQRVDVVRTPSPAGSKSGGAIDVAQLAIVMAPVSGLVAGVAAVCVARIRADAARSIRLKLGQDEITLRGSSQPEQQQLIEAWLDALNSKGQINE